MKLKWLRQKQIPRTQIVGLTTKWWIFLVKFKDVRKYQILLKDIKYSYSIKVTEYKKTKKIEYKPYFILWVTYTLSKRDILIMGVSYMVKNNTHKYGIDMHNNVLDAYRSYKVNWGDYCRKSPTK